MASVADWVEAARVRTLPAAAAPVLSGTGVAIYHRSWSVAIALLCLVVALALQIGVNFANDYSDGIRGTDADRVGPQRLVGAGLVPPHYVKYAAFGCFGVAAVAGLVITIVTGYWWFIAVGLASMVAAWYYTGGSHPYGYAGLGEVFVFIFFGFVAVAGTTFAQSGYFGTDVLAVVIGIGALACAILVCNNLRDLDTDRRSGKLTLETRLGDRGSRTFYCVLLVAALVMAVVLAWVTSWWALLALVSLPLLALATRAIVAGQTGFALVATLKLTSIGQLVYSLGILAGLSVATVIAG